MYEYSFQDNKQISHGDIRVVNLPVQVLFVWSDEIIADYDSETDTVLEYTSGWVMKVLPGQIFAYQSQETTFLSQALIEK